MSSLAQPTSQPSPSKRLWWKETQRLIPIFVGLFYIGCLAQLALSWFCRLNPLAFAHPEFMCTVIIGCFSALFATAASVTLFTVEKEENTYKILQLLPVSPRTIVLTKLCAATVLCILFFLFSCVFATVSFAFGCANQVPWFSGFVVAFGIATIEFFVVGLLFSLTCRSTLFAALSSIFIASLMLQIAIVLSRDTHPGFASLQVYSQAWRTRLFLILPIIGLIFPFASRWLSGTLATAKSERRERSINLLTQPFKRLSQPFRTRSKPILRLMWQNLCQSWLVSLLGFTGTLGFAICVSMIDQGLLFFTIPLGLSAAGVLGLTGCTADQNPQTNHFLKTRAISPTNTFLSRSIPWILFLLLIHLVILAVFFAFVTIIARYEFHLLAIFNQNESQVVAVWALSTKAITLSFIGSTFCFAVGQFLSYLIPNRIFAVMLTLVSSILASYWFFLMVLGGVPIWFSILVPTISLFVASWLQIRAINNSRGIVWRACVPIGLVILTAGLILFMTYEHRRTEIPQSNFESSERRRDMSKEHAALLVTIEPLHFNFLHLLSPQQRSAVRNSNNESSFDFRAGPEYAAVRMQFVEELFERRSDLREQNWKQLIKLAGQIDLIWQNRRYLPNTSASDRSSPQVLFYVVNCRQLLTLYDFEFQTSLAAGDAKRSWTALRTYIRLSHLNAITMPYKDFWYRSALDKIEEWVRCENQDADLLLEASKVVSQELVALPAVRIIEHEHTDLGEQQATYRRSNRFSLTHKFFALGTNFLSRLTCERERTNRLLTQAAKQQNELHSNLLISQTFHTSLHQASTPELWRAVWREHNPNFIGYREIIRNRHNDSYEADGFKFWTQTTFLPSVNGREYLKILDPRFNQLAAGKEPNVWVLQRHFWERKNLTACQIFAVRHKLLNGRYPTTDELAEHLNDQFFCRITPNGVSTFRQGLSLDFSE